MTENYAAEDFAQANLATRDKFGVARRADPRLAHQWHVYGGTTWRLSDEEMAADGWVPVVESQVTEGTLRHVEERAERKRQKLIAHIESVEAAVRDRNRTIEELRSARKEDGRREHGVHVRNVYVHRYAWERKDLDDLRRENRRLDAEADGAISLDDLEAAWEAAEVADECREGDVLIIRDDEDNYLVRRMCDRSDLDSAARILSRAPRREPWADLEDVLGDFAIHDHDGKEYPDVLAQRLYERGVRVTGGGE